MTIGIAIATTDTVLLVADGRQSTAEETVSDTAEKIHVLRDDLALISFGVGFSTDMVLQWMKHEKVPRGAVEFSAYLRDRVWAAGSSLLQQLSPESRISDRMKVGLVGGGADSEGPYITGSLFGANMESAASETSRCVNSTFVYMILGGEDVRSSDFFEELAKQSIASTTQPESIIPTLLRVAITTVRFAASGDRTIGGRIQFTILRQGQLPQTGFID